MQHVNQQCVEDAGKLRFAKQMMAEGKEPKKTRVS